MAWYPDENDCWKFIQSKSKWYDIRSPHPCYCNGKNRSFNLVFMLHASTYVPSYFLLSPIPFYREWWVELMSLRFDDCFERTSMIEFLERLRKPTSKHDTEKRERSSRGDRQRRYRYIISQKATLMSVTILESVSVWFRQPRFVDGRIVVAAETVASGVENERKAPSVRSSSCAVQVYKLSDSYVGITLCAEKRLFGDSDRDELYR